MFKNIQLQSDIILLCSLSRYTNVHAPLPLGSIPSLEHAAVDAKRSLPRRAASRLARGREGESVGGSSIPPPIQLGARRAMMRKARVGAAHGEAVHDAASDRGGAGGTASAVGRGARGRARSGGTSGAGTDAAGEDGVGEGGGDGVGERRYILSVCACMRRKEPPVIATPRESRAGLAPWSSTRASWKVSFPPRRFGSEGRIG